MPVTVNGHDCSFHYLKGNEIEGDRPASRDRSRFTRSRSPAQNRLDLTSPRRPPF